MLKQDRPPGSSAIVAWPPFLLGSVLPNTQFLLSKNALSKATSLGPYPDHQRKPLLLMKGLKKAEPELGWREGIPFENQLSCLGGSVDHFIGGHITFSRTSSEEVPSSRIISPPSSACG
jgi:hypothetical protein